MCPLVHSCTLSDSCRHNRRKNMTWQVIDLGQHLEYLGLGNTVLRPNLFQSCRAESEGRGKRKVLRHSQRKVARCTIKSRCDTDFLSCSL